MRILGVIAAAFVALWAVPASAVTIFTISGELMVTKRISYGPGSPNWASPTVTQKLVKFAFSDVDATSTDGILYTFNEYRPQLRGGISGTFKYIGNGAFEGVSLWYADRNASGADPFIERYGETDTFHVYQTYPAPVPEPVTWLLLIVGFGAMGAVLRRQQSVTANGRASAVH